MRVLHRINVISTLAQKVTEVICDELMAQSTRMHPIHMPFISIIDIWQ
jgi:hypothetical protein